MRRIKTNRASGYSLLELLVVLAVLMLTAVFVLDSSYLSGDSGEALITEAARRTRQRRAEAVQLNAATGTNGIERGFSQPPLVIDFAQPETTRTLRIEGSGATHLACPPTHPRTSVGLCEKINSDGTRERTLGTWDYQYVGLALRTKGGWNVALDNADLGRVPQMEGTRLTTQLEFTSNGRLRPVNANPADTAQPATVWAIYFVKGDNDARALLVTDAGQVEVCRWDDGAWRGFGDRLIANMAGSS